MKRNGARSLTSVFLSLFLSLQALGQTATTTSISGVVSDPQGAAVLGATVTVKDLASRRSICATTRSSVRSACP